MYALDWKWGCLCFSPHCWIPCWVKRQTCGRIITSLQRQCSQAAEGKTQTLYACFQKVWWLRFGAGFPAPFSTPKINSSFKEIPSKAPLLQDRTSSCLCCVLILVQTPTSLHTKCHWGQAGRFGLERGKEYRPVFSSTLLGVPKLILVE